MPLLWMAMAAMLWQVPTDASSNKAFVRDNEIWVQTASAQRQLTHDGVPKRLPAVSPSGDTLIYVVDRPVPLNAPEETIVLLDTEGKVRQTIVPQGYVPGAFDRLEWIDDQRIGAMTCGHANCMYWVLDPVSGKTIQVMSGGFDFIWSHNRRFVARYVMADWGVGQEKKPLAMHDGVLLNRDGVFVYPPERTGGQSTDDGQTHDLGYGDMPRFVWSPDDNWVAFTDLIGPQDDWYVVVVSPTGDMLRDTVPIDPDFGAILTWVDDTHLELHAAGRTFHFVLSGKQFSEVRAPR